jgi:hypothetical protein
LTYRFFDVFFSRVHCWYPFLDPPSTKATYSGPTLPKKGTMYCKFLLIMILGMLADHVEERDIAPRVDEAFGMLAEVIVSDSLDSVHCLILMRYKIIVSFE